MAWCSLLSQCHFCFYVQVEVFLQNQESMLKHGVIQQFNSFGGLVVSMLASGTQDCGFKPD
jgi:hypothetical protein